MEKGLDTKAFHDFVETVLGFTTHDDLSAFLRDVATIKELFDMTARWQAAQMVHQGISYREIAKNTGLSTATVTRVAHWLKYGEGGYRRAIEKKKHVLWNM